MSDTDSRIQRFHTGMVSRKDGFAFWADEIGPHVGRLDSPERSHFQQELTIVDTAGMAFMRVHGSGATIERTGPSQLMGAEVYPYHLLIKLDGGLAISEQRQRIELAAGDMVLIDSWQPLRLRSTEATNSWTLGLSEAVVNRWLPHADQSTDLRLAGAKGWAGMLSGYLRALDVEHLCSIQSPAQRQLLGEHLMSMLSFSLEQNGLRAQPGALGERVSPRDGDLHARMRAWIREHHADTEIDAQKLAASFNVSVRYVHKVFAKAGRGMTFLETLQNDRLEAAARMLRSPEGARRFVAQVAYDCGFADPAYFGLVFRKKYGCTPRTFALQQGQAAADGTLLLS
ncbi:AraC family transcriptional regulator [Variovorax boronicumulans]|uniref:AraC family transcriptional regulator n=1 Tax=Variovorax boronicumulans TaxID=436515 RepID=UPI0012E409B1|nr:AraC family transcriptional regulator [Variovorax boronicumulans]GER11246.1 AraC family transcriptional regulator [Variovorax boronicumulans]